MTARDLAELVRLPALLSVPGDALLGAAAGGAGTGGRLVASSGLLYLSGMALNDYADRAVDMLERPSRPIPSGRVAARTAHRLAVGGTLGGLLAARMLGGPRALRVALPLSACVWAYDLRAKQGPAGPAVMAACRALDVLLGASQGSVPAALPAALVVAAHTATLSMVSRDEVRGGAPAVAAAALTRTTRVAAAAGGLALSHAWGARRGATRGVPLLPAVLSGALLLQYVREVGGGYRAAVDEPTPARFQQAVGRAVLGSAVLQAALLAGAGAVPQAAAVATARPVATALARRRGVS